LIHDFAGEDPDQAGGPKELPASEPAGIRFPMTVTQFCSLTDLSASQVTALREAGVISPDLPPDQAGRARLIQALKAKGIPLSRLAAADLAFDAGSASYAVYDGHQLRTCRDAVPAIGVAGEAPLLPRWKRA